MARRWAHLAPAVHAAVHAHGAAGRGQRAVQHTVPVRLVGDAAALELRAERSNAALLQTQSPAGCCPTATVLYSTLLVLLF